MPMVKVWNDNKHPHTESFKGEKITIGAGECIEMEWEEAVEFRGQFTGVAPIADNGEPDPKFFKMIRVDQVKPEQIFRDDGLTNHATGKKASSPEELRAVLAEFKGLLITDPDAETSKSSEIAELRAQLAELTRLVQGDGEKRGPGRPKKEATA